MNIKKIGAAVADVKKEMWSIPTHNLYFEMDRRIIDTHQETKAVNKQYAKTIGANTPSRFKPDRRKEYFQSRDEYYKAWEEALSRIFQEIQKDAESFPIPLKRHKDYDFHGEWRYCLYKGIVYQLDRPGYSDEEILKAIGLIERQANPDSLPNPEESQ